MVARCRVLLGAGAPAVHDVAPRAVWLLLPDGQILREALDARTVLAIPGEDGVPHREAQVAGQRDFAVHGVPDQRVLLRRGSERLADRVRAADELSRPGEDLSIAGRIASERFPRPELRCVAGE